MPKINEKKFTIILCALAFIGLSFFTYDAYRQRDLAPKVNLSTQEAVTRASDFLEQHLGVNLDDYTHSTKFANDSIGDSLIYKTLKEDKGIEYLRDNNLPPLVYSVRFFKELEQEEFSVAINTETKKVYSFHQVLSENQERPELKEKEARKLANNFITKQGFDLNELKEINFKANKKEKRLDYEFNFRFKNSNIPTEFGDMHREIWVSILGDKVGGFAYYLFTPEDFGRSINSQMGNGMLIATLSLLASALMIILALVVLIKQYKDDNINKKLFLTISISLAAVLVLDNFNSLGFLKNTYMTDISFIAFWGMSIILPLVAVLFVATGIFISGAAGEAIAKKIWLDKISGLKDKIFSHELSVSIFKGYLIAFILLGLTALIYLIGEKYLGVWALADLGAGYNTLLSFVPAFSIFAGVGLLAAVSEEFLYRLFGISFFKQKFKSTFWAVLIVTIIWAVAHSTYPVFPFYFRAIELLIGGAIFGYCFVRYNITTTITAHYVFNSILSLMILLLAGSVFTIFTGVLVVALPGIIALKGWQNKKSWFKFWKR